MRAWRILWRREFWIWLGRRRAFSYLLGAVIISAVYVASGAGGATAPGPLPNDGATHVVVFDVGQGDAVLIRTASGDDILIDGGPDDRVVDKLAAYLPPGDRDLELVVLTHPHADHLVGLLAVLERFSVRRIVHSGRSHTSELYETLLSSVRSRSLALETARAGDTYAFGDTRLVVLHAGATSSDINDASLVVRMDRGTESVLLQGDATERVEAVLLAASTTLRADVLKVGHHGSKYSSTPAYLTAVRPRAALISAGRGNRYGHPSLRTLGRLEKAGSRVYRTDEQGDLRVDVFTDSFRVTPLHTADRCGSITRVCR